VVSLLAAQFRQAAAHGIHEKSSPGQEIIVRKGDRRWLRDIGFTVDCYLKVFELAVFGGRRP
jgi:hypothetical protein